MLQIGEIVRNRWEIKVGYFGWNLNVDNMFRDSLGQAAMDKSMWLEIGRQTRMWPSKQNLPNAKAKL